MHSLELSNVTFGYETASTVLFRDLGDAPDPAGWEGWDGDRFVVAECGEQLEFAWLTAWDTEDDAREFEAAYAGIAEAVAGRAGHGARPQTRREEREVVVASPGLRDWGAADTDLVAAMGRIVATSLTDVVPAGQPGVSGA